MRVFTTNVFFVTDLGRGNVHQLNQYFATTSFLGDM